MSVKRSFPGWLICLAGFALVWSSCRHQPEKAKKPGQTALVKEVYYTCSMHPQIREDHPGRCPICGMELIPVPKAGTTMTDQVRLNEQQIRLGNIRVDTIKNGSIGDRMVFTGILNFNQEKLGSVNTRVGGRIEKLYLKKKE